MFTNTPGNSVDVTQRPRATQVVEVETACGAGLYPINGTTWSWTGTAPVQVVASHVSYWSAGGRWYLRVVVTGPGTFTPYLVCGAGEQLPA